MLEGGDHDNIADVIGITLGKPKQEPAIIHCLEFEMIVLYGSYLLIPPKITT
jgi:hypothetical protein